MVPGRSELVEGGINAAYWNATREGGPRNGVLTAIEDFAAEHDEPCELVVVPGWHGLAVLASQSRLEAAPKLAAAISSLSSPEYLRAQLERIERARIVTGMRRGTGGGGGSGAADARDPRLRPARRTGLIGRRPGDRDLAPPATSGPQPSRLTRLRNFLTCLRCQSAWSLRQPSRSSKKRLSLAIAWPITSRISIP